MTLRALRMGALCAMIITVTACSNGSPDQKYTPPPIDQAAYKKSLAAYMGAAGNNFQGFSIEKPLEGSSQCNIDNAGKDNATVECRLNTPAKADDAKTLYTQQKDLFTKSLPSDARGAEQTNAVPNTPFRYTAVSKNSGAVLILTQNGADWYVGYVFQRIKP